MVLLLRKEQLVGMDLSVHVKGGGHIAQTFAIYQSTFKALVILLSEICRQVSKKKKKIKDILNQDEDTEHC